MAGAPGDRHRDAGPLPHRPASCSYRRGLTVCHQGRHLRSGKLEDELPVATDEGKQRPIRQKALTAEHVAPADARVIELIERQFVEYPLCRRPPISALASMTGH